MTLRDTTTTTFQPYYPQGNGRIERSFKTDEEEFYQQWQRTHPQRKEALSDIS